MPAGASVIQPVNVSGKYRLSSSISYEQFVTKIKSTFSAGISAGSSRDPYYIADVLHNLDDVSFTASLGYMLNLDKLRFNLAPSFTYDIYTNDGSGAERNSLTFGLNANVTNRIGNHFEWNLGCGYQKTVVSFEDANYSNLQISAVLSWVWGKNSNYSISLVGNDLSNGYSSKTSVITSDYTGWSHSLYLGRNVCLMFRYVFSRR